MKAILIMAGACALATIARSDEPPDGWQLIADLRFNDARASFSKPESASDRFGLAVALLGAQPKTEANLNRAEKLLEDLASGEDDAFRPRAAYLHARISHVHRQPADWAEAARRYQAVYKSYPNHPLGQRAFVRSGIVSLFRPAEPAALQAQLAPFLKEAVHLTDPEALRDLDWLLAALYERRLHDPAATLAHVEKLLASPVPLRELTRLSFLVQAGELARELGDRSKAARYYREFLDTTRRDGRVFLIRQRLTEMEATP